MKVSWLKRLSCDESDWKEFTLNMYPKLSNLKMFGAESINVIIQSIKNPFWKDVLCHYKKICLKCCPTSVHEFMTECIFL